MKQKIGVLKDKKKIHQALIIVTVIVLLAVIAFVAGNITGQYKDRAPRYSFAFSATGLSDGSGNIMDIHGGGKITRMAGVGWGPSFWYWNVWIDGHGIITFVTAGNKQSINWKPSSTALYDQLTNTLNFTLKTSEKLPDWVITPITVTLIGSGDSTGSIIVNTGPSIYSGIGVVVIQ
jgi:hypothetical protein